MDKRQPHLTSPGALLLSVICWGLAPVSTRYILNYLSPIDLLIARFCLASLLLLPVLITFRRTKWTRRDFLLLLFCSITGIIGYNVPVTFGIRLIPAGTASLIIATEAIWITILSLLFLRERPHWTMVIGLLLAFVGVGILLGRVDIGSSTSMLAGVSLTLLGAIMWSIYTVSIRPLIRKHGPLICTGLTTMIGTIPLLSFSESTLASHLRALSATAWLAFFLLAIGSTVGATMLWNYGLQKIPGSQAGLFLYLVPFISVIAGSIFLGEVISPGIILGGLFIVGGVILAQVRQLRKAIVPTSGPDNAAKQEPAAQIQPEKA